MRARSVPARVDATLKAAELLTRYLSIVALASWSESADVASDELLPYFEGNLSFGSFLRIPQDLAKRSTGQHRVLGAFRRGFAKQRESDIPLVRLLELRNSLGHDVIGLDEARATHIERSLDPISDLLAALNGVRTVLDMPIVVVEEQRFQRGQLEVRFVCLRGEDEPIPEVDVWLDGVDELNSPYLVTPAGLLCLSPGVVWDVQDQRRQFGLFVLHSVGLTELHFRSIDDGGRLTGESVEREALDRWLLGRGPGVRDVRRSDGTLLSRTFGERFRTSRSEPVPGEPGETGDQAQVAVPLDHHQPSGAQTPVTLLEDHAQQSPTSVELNETTPGPAVIAELGPRLDPEHEPSAAPIGRRRLLDFSDGDWRALRLGGLERELLDHLVDLVVEDSPECVVAPMGSYIQVAAGGVEFLTVTRRRGYLLCVLPLDPHLRSHIEGTRDLSSIRHWGRGDLGFELRAHEQLSVMRGLIREAREAADAAIDADDGRRDLLLDLFVVQGRSLDEAAASLGITDRQLRSELQFRGLSPLLSAVPKHLRFGANEVHLYEDGANAEEIALSVVAAKVVVIRALREAGAVLRPDDLELVGGEQKRLGRTFLEREFLGNKRTLEDIGTEVGVSRERVRQVLEKYGMPNRVDRSLDPATRISRERLTFLYEQRGQSLGAIGSTVDLRADEVAQLVDRWELSRPRVHQRYGLTKELLEAAYVNERKSVLTIAAEFDVPRQAVSAALKYHGIVMRTRAEAISRGLDQLLTSTYLSERLNAGHPISEIAAEAGTTATTVMRYLSLAGLRPPEEPDPTFDHTLAEAIVRRALSEGQTIHEFASSVGVPAREVSLRMQAWGIEGSRRRGRVHSSLPTEQEVNIARAAGRLHDKNPAVDRLTQLYVVEGLPLDECARRLEVSRGDALRELVALGIDIRIGVADVLSPPFLIRRYVDEEATAVEIAQETRLTSATVGKALVRAGIAVRPRGHRGTPSRLRAERLTLMTPDYLQREYVDGGRSAASVAKEIGVSAHDVLDAVRGHDLPVRPVTGGSQRKAELQQLLTKQYLHAELIEKGKAIEDLASEVGTTVRVIERYIARAGVVPGA